MKKESEKENLKKIFYILLIAFAIISFWRGIWQLSDLYLFPNNYVLSNLASLFVGIIILYFTKHLVDLK